MREGQWLKKELKRTELQGKTLGILGLGRIGLALAVRARAFQMHVLGWHPDSHFTDFAEIRPTMEEVLRESDFVSLHMPLLTETGGLINKQTLNYFKNGAYLITTARAGIIVEDDVIAALESGKLGGYATDVWLTDPPTTSPLFDAPNTLFTPHIGASTAENMTRISVVARSAWSIGSERADDGAYSAVSSCSTRRGDVPGAEPAAPASESSTSAASLRRSSAMSDRAFQRS